MSRRKTILFNPFEIVLSGANASRGKAFRCAFQLTRARHVAFFLFQLFNMTSASVYRPTATVLCLIGIGLSLYAYYVETRKTSDPSYRAACDISERMSCTRVLTSRWGRGFGLFDSNSPLNLPDSLYGLAYYCLSLILNRSWSSTNVARVRVLLSIMTNLGSVYLGYILYFVLRDLCLVCCGMYAVNFLLFVCNVKLLTMTNVSKRKAKKQ